MHVFKNTRLQGLVERGYSFSTEGNFVLSALWVVSGLVMWLIPLIYRTIHKNKYQKMYMRYFYEKEYEYEMEQKAKMYEQYGNSYNYGGAYMYSGNNYGSNREYWDVNDCRWWQINCFPYYINRNGEPMPEQGWYPSWYSGWTVTEEERELMESGREQPGSLKFVYIWQLFTFLAILFYGVLVICQHRNPTGLLIALFVWTNFAFLSMWLMADGSIHSDGDGVLRTGFYGQLSVLIFMSNFWYFLHGVIFLIIFGMRKWMMDEVKSHIGDDDEKKKSPKKFVDAPEARTESSYRAPFASESSQL